MVLKIDDNGTFRDVHIREGDVFLLPGIHLRCFRGANAHSKRAALAATFRRHSGHGDRAKA